MICESQGYSRLGAAFHGLHKYDEASAAYEKGLQIEPTNAALLAGSAEVQKAAMARQSNPMMGVAQAFASDEIIGLIASDPSTRAYLQDPSFMTLLGEIRRNPGSIGQYALR